ncbi:3-phosphoglycerate dehydrogenase [archaeon]|nr:3-phosphoglycerate dehydrogenase [archaeon]NDB80536.1 3-phosphoglycerate dehydrogenase [archaeon]
MKILANDGISESGKIKLEQYGFTVDLTSVAQNQLVDYINENSVSTLLVRSATQVRKDVIDSCPSLKIIGRGGVGMDNIDVEYARSKGIHVINTPAASSKSVAELVFAHLFGCVRFLHESNRLMPLDGDSKFKELKKSFSGGKELSGKKIGIIGFGRIGQEVAKIALGIGMEVIYYDKYINEAKIDLTFYDNQNITFNLVSSDLNKLLEISDFISIHVPASDKYLIDKEEFEIMKDKVGILNLSRGGIINESELIKSIDSGKISFAGIDTFENEPVPSIKVLMNNSISLTPHIGAATSEAQDRIGVELADKINELLNQ